MRSLSVLQSEILDSNVKNGFVLVEITLDGSESVDYYYSNQAKTFNGQAYTFKVTNVDPITLRAGNPELGTLPKNSTRITLTNKDNTLTASSFIDAYVEIKILLGADVALVEDIDGLSFESSNYQEDDFLTFGFKVVAAYNVYQQITLELQDWFTAYLDGDYPKTRLVSDLFPADIMKNDSVCVPKVWGQPYFPLRLVFYNVDATYVDADTLTLSGDHTGTFVAGMYLTAFCGVDGAKRGWIDTISYSAGTGLTTINFTAASDDLTSNLTRVQIDCYLLGTSSGITYTMDRACVPKEENFKQTYLPATYTFRQINIIGSDSVSYKAVQLICNDADGDGTNDANGTFGISSKEAYDVPFRFTRSDTSTTTNLATIIEQILLDIGIPSARIDDTSVTAAEAAITARGVAANVGIYYYLSREKFLCKLFVIAGIVPIVRDKIYFKTLTKTSQLTIEENLIVGNSFQISPRIYRSDQKDSGYVVWQESDEPVDLAKKNLISAKSGTSNPADNIIEAEWVDSSADAKASAKLALQRIVLPSDDVNFTALIKIGHLEPKDIITINPANLGTDGTPYDIQIEEITWNQRFAGLQIKCTKFRDALDDWDDLSETAVIVHDADTTYIYSPVNQGPVDAEGNGSNQITQTVMIGTNGVLSTNEDPATNGGFMATNEQLICYNTSGAERFKVIYSGADQGDVVIGDYDNGKGVKWDQGDTTLQVRGGLATTTGSVKRFEISATDNEAHFYGDRGDGTIEELATIGVKSSGGDSIIGYFGSTNSSHFGIYVISSTVALTARSNSGIAINVYSIDGLGIYSISLNGYGAYLSGGKSPLLLNPSDSASAPSHTADKGSLWVTSEGVLYINTDGSTTWQKVGSQ